MEADTILKMVENAFWRCYFIVDVIVSNDYIIMQAVLKHTSRDARVQVLNSSKGNFYEEIPLPSFLADPSHHMKVVSEHINSIVKYVKSQKCGCKKAYALRIKKDWGYMINNSRNKNLKELWQASKVLLEHMFNNHDNCGSELCFKTRESTEGK